MKCGSNRVWSPCLLLIYFANTVSSSFPITNNDIIESDQMPTSTMFPRRRMNYRHRSRTFSSLSPPRERLKKSFGVTSNKREYDEAEQMKVFQQWAPPRSTIGPEIHFSRMSIPIRSFAVQTLATSSSMHSRSSPIPFSSGISMSPSKETASPSSILQRKHIKDKIIKSQIEKPMSKNISTISGTVLSPSGVQIRQIQKRKREKKGFGKVSKKKTTSVSSTSKNTSDKETLRLYSDLQNERNNLIRKNVDNKKEKINKEMYRMKVKATKEREGYPLEVQRSFIEELGRKIESVGKVLFKKEVNLHPLQYQVKNGMLFENQDTPIAILETHRPLSTIKRIDRKLSADMMKRMRKNQTKVPSSNQTSEVGTLAPAALEGHIERWRISPPVSPPIYHPPRARADKTEINRAIFPDDLIEKEKKNKDDNIGLNDIMDDTTHPPPYPFSHCYMNSDGFMCCNRFLESLLRRSYHKLSRTENFKDCSVQKIANQIQKDCEQVFNTTFETIVGIDDFALRAHFAGDLMCKIEQGGRILAAYATAMPSRPGSQRDPLHVVTPISMNIKQTRRGSQRDGAVATIQKPDVYPLHSIRKKAYHELSREELDNEFRRRRV